MLRRLMYETDIKTPFQRCQITASDFESKWALKAQTISAGGSPLGVNMFESP